MHEFNRRIRAHVLRWEWERKGEARLLTLHCLQLHIRAPGLYFLPRCTVYICDIITEIPASVRIMLVMWCSILPPVVNPIIYCLRTQEIKTVFMKRMRGKIVNLKLKPSSCWDKDVMLEPVYLKCCVYNASDQMLQCKDILHALLHF